MEYDLGAAQAEGILVYATGMIGEMNLDLAQVEASCGSFYTVNWTIMIKLVGLRRSIRPTVSGQHPVLQAPSNNMRIDHSLVATSVRREILQACWTQWISVLREQCQHDSKAAKGRGCFPTGLGFLRCSNKSPKSEKSEMESSAQKAADSSQYGSGSKTTSTAIASQTRQAASSVSKMPTFTSIRQALAAGPPIRLGTLMGERDDASAAGSPENLKSLLRDAGNGNKRSRTELKFILSAGVLKGKVNVRNSPEVCTALLDIFDSLRTRIEELNQSIKEVKDAKTVNGRGQREQFEWVLATYQQRVLFLEKERDEVKHKFTAQEDVLRLKEQESYAYEQRLKELDYILRAKKRYFCCKTRRRMRKTSLPALKLRLEGPYFPCLGGRRLTSVKLCAEWNRHSSSTLRD
jgi:hypothetical protein